MSRQKQLRLVLSFRTAAAAMALERLCLDRGLPGRLIPTPRQITADCGLAWSAPPEAEAALRAAAEERGVLLDGTYYLEI